MNETCCFLDAVSFFFFPRPHSVSELRANEQGGWNVCFWIHAHISPVYSPGGEPYGALADTTRPRLILDSTSPARTIPTAGTCTNANVST
jgi:hypothetical protein